MTDLTLHPNRDFSVLRRHPWIFSGAVAKVGGAPAPGDPVRVLASDGSVLGTGAYSPTSQIRVRMWTFDPSAVVDAAFVTERVARAVRATLDADAATTQVVSSRPITPGETGDAQDTTATQ